MTTQVVAAALVGTLLLPTGVFAQQQSAPSQPAPGSTDIVQPQGPRDFTLKVNSDLVLTNVVVRDKRTGKVMEGLKASDFTLLENGKPQKITSFDFENVDQVAALQEQTVSGKSSAPNLQNAASAFDPETLRNHRLIVMFFDLTSMQFEDVKRSVDAAKKFINTQMSPADLVALISLGNAVTLDQDFSADKPMLLRALDRYTGAEGAGFANGSDGTTNGTADTSADYTPDESEYNAVNTDRKLYAIASIAQSLSRITQKKALLYFSGGLTKTGIENQASLRAATNAAVRGNMSIYSVDTTGLDALPPVGDATTGSLRGSAAYNGVAMQNQLDANFQSQETLSSLSTDTGGKAFFDSNDFAPAFTQLQKDTAEYYVLGFHSTNQARDGAFRKLTIKVNNPNAKIEARPGYYAPADFRHSNNSDRERQLEHELASDLPSTDLPVYMQALYFRLDKDRYYTPISLVVPGSEIPFQTSGNRDKATLDVIGEVKDSAGHSVADARDTVKLALDQSQQARSRNIQYTTGFMLAPGKYHVKFVVRENITGKMGSFEADIVIPDLTKLPLKMSSVVLASQRIPASKKAGDDPLIRDGQEWVPNVAHVFRQDQHLYLLYEVYDPKGSAGSPASAAKGRKKQEDAASAVPASGVKVLTSIEFLNGSQKVFETPVVQATQLNDPGKDAVAFQLDVPLASIKPGLYTCQINVIDDSAGAYTFPRVAMLVRDAAPGAPAPPAAAPAAGAQPSGGR